MPCQSVPHTHKASSCVVLKRFISVTSDTKTKEIELVPAALDEVPRFKGDGCTQKEEYTVVFAVGRLFTLQV